MTGIELARSIINHDQDTKVVMLISGADWDTNRERADEAGVTVDMPKPLFVSTVVDCINELLSTDSFAEGSDTKKEEANFEGKTVLLVEDVEINREIVMALLEPTHLKIECAVNGIKAVEEFTRNPDKYDMIFMDIQMPEMDGFTATEKIRATGFARSKTIPIVAMTANAFKEDIEKCIASGMNGHLGKPLSYDMVIATLERYLHGKQ